MSSRLIRVTIALAAIACIGLVCPLTSSAQVVFTPAGVDIDANGVLRTKIFPDPSGQLTRQRIAAAKSVLNPDVMRPSKLRKISLNRLEKAIAARLDAGQNVTEEMNYLAGLTRITHVFYYPETKDIVIAGPAEGFFPDLSGRIVGMTTGKATLRLEDLIVALRAFPASGKKTGYIGCSIDPTQEGLKRMQDAYRSEVGNFRPGDEARVVDKFRSALGMQNVTIRGVAPNTHFAQVLVEADYRMKLIGIGLEQTPVKITSFIEKAKPGSGSNNGLQRWYFEPDYDCLTVSEDEHAMRLDGNGAKLVGANERVAADGARVKSARVNRASKAFTTSFTKKFNALAEKSPVFAELRNMIDLSIVAAFIQEMDYYGKADWSATIFGDEQKLSVENYATPKQVEPAINAVWKSNYFMTPIGGGVSIQPRLALTVDHMQTDESGEIAKTRQQVSLDELEEGQWWWD